MKKIIMTLSVLALSLFASITAQATTADEIYKEYSKVISWFLPLRDVEPRNIYYGLYDIDKNGIPEFILRDYYCETDSPYHIYTYTSSGLVYLGEYEGSHTSIYEYAGNGFVYYGGMGGYGQMKLYQLSNNKLKSVKTVDVTPNNYRTPGQVFAGADKQIKLYSYWDTQYTYKSNISYEISNRTKSGAKIGNVLNTDVRTFVNGIEIPCFSINNRCVVVVEDLRSCGFSVEWNQYSKSLVISKSKYPVFNKMAIPYKQKTGSVFSPIYSTDINVYYINDNMEKSEITAHAINGYMLISPESIHDNGISFSYDNAYRRLDMTLNN